jgi:hypothetical protein
MKSQLRANQRRVALLLLAAFTILRARADGQNQPGGRFALLIGNSNYVADDPVNGIKDADEMAEYLRQLHFAVTPPLHDATLKEMKEALTTFGSQISNASVVVFFFSGHGYQTGNDNFLVPTDGSIVPASSISLTNIKNTLALAPDAAVKLVFLDACREDKHIPTGKPQGLDPTLSPSLPATLYAFATGPNLTAPAGSPDGYSPFTLALLNSIREPGLGIIKLLDRVKKEVADENQLPAVVNFGVPPEFFLQPPVVAQATIPSPPQSDLFVVLNGNVVLDSTQASGAALPLNPGENSLSLLVSNGKTYRNGQTWERTEGWKYAFQLDLPDGRRLPFGDSEDVPFKDGPHHGKVFTVFRAKLIVDETGKLPVQLKDSDDKAWDHDPRFYAQNQGVLYEKAVKDLPLDDILDPSTFPSIGFLPGPTVASFLRELLTNGTFLGQKVADPARTYFRVHGNRELQRFAAACLIAAMDDRVKDLRASLAAAVQRAPRPFDSFDQALSHCFQNEVSHDLTFGPPLPDVLVWTAIEDESDIPPSPTASTGSAGTASSGGGHG